MASPLIDNETKVLWKLGYIRVIDFIVILNVLGIGVVDFFWWFFGHPTTTQLLCSALCVALLLQVWTLLLVYRCARFVLDVFAEIKTMPEQAAKLAVQFRVQQGDGA